MSKQSDIIDRLKAAKAKSDQDLQVIDNAIKAVEETMDIVDQIMPGVFPGELGKQLKAIDAAVGGVVETFKAVEPTMTGTLDDNPYTFMKDMLLKPSKSTKPNPRTADSTTPLNAPAADSSVPLNAESGGNGGGKKNRAGRCSNPNPTPEAYQYPLRTASENTP